MSPAGRFGFLAPLRMTVSLGGKAVLPFGDVDEEKG